MYSACQNNRATIQTGPIDYLDTYQSVLYGAPTLTGDFIKSHLEKMKRDYPGVYNQMQTSKIKQISNVGSFEKFWVWLMMVREVKSLKRL
ncbi:MAG: hypothetical protein CM1200mP1_09660 [Candidatus Neomarinimicrobiota bacterium]|nr:MAG: hypothetical protein CM1200mP1_09660 [Candidatus Neomarinimicrobiota bacterium]